MEMFGIYSELKMGNAALEIQFSFRGKMTFYILKLVSTTSLQFYTIAKSTLEDDWGCSDELLLHV